MNILNFNIGFAFIFIVSLFTTCGNTNQQTENKDSIENSDQNTEAYNYDKIIKDQDSLLKIHFWPGKHSLDLNDDGIDEEFLAIEGYLRGMGYVLFSREGNRWKPISGEEIIPAGHLGMNKLDSIKGGWHDFVAIQPSGREGIIESYYTWNGNQYTLKEQKEVEY